MGLGTVREMEMGMGMEMENGWFEERSVLVWSLFGRRISRRKHTFNVSRLNSQNKAHLKKGNNTRGV